MWDLPGPGLEPMSPELAGGFLTTAPPGKYPHLVFMEVLWGFCSFVAQCWFALWVGGEAGQGAQRQFQFQLKISGRSCRNWRTWMTVASHGGAWCGFWSHTQSQGPWFLLLLTRRSGAGIQLSWYYSPSWKISLVNDSHFRFWSSTCLMSLKCFASQLFF